MAEIIKIFREEIPALRFIGKRYPDFGPWWGEWFANGWFDIVEKAMGGQESILKIWENGGGYIGLEHRTPNKPFEYWIGMFTPIDTNVPEGFEYVDFPAVGLGTCWIYGKESEIHDTSKCRESVENCGYEVWQDEEDGAWSFENCICPRYTSPDAHGNIVMDYCYFVEK